ncbi:hypothetical protein GUITHDRAFT_113537 [Guillardia theta CCMP2712]|uniref:Uncharacterized protein n=1 Tax=Guillardia theta (strain CCMP2712) TaxID=905079 RepID=L1IWR5_GUITC|nr:hypothetical protein GUITHDRAFT_113537 [Guillardia theta CCMP2712]EKX40294.1 hypothetical protein GUITHDRAFT_113537 [Guillardia theta CCMP2712]|eukprot:XP_005827274.1 hypothetical protein GUITHDRAFT_113537 [Guillardia theta CCMP2712]
MGRGCAGIRSQGDEVTRDTRQPTTKLWADGMSAAQARKALFGNNSMMSGSSRDSLGLGGKSAISKYMKLANPGMFH